MHDLAHQQERWDHQAQFDAVNQALQPQPVTFDPLATLGGAALTGVGLALIVLAAVAALGA